MASLSPLDQLKARREELLAEQIFDIPVPRWLNPTLQLQIKPVDHSTFRRIIGIQERAAKGPKQQVGESELNANAAMVGAALVKVLIGDGDERAEVDWQDMIPSLGISETSSVTEVVRAICLRDGDVLTLASTVLKLSGYSTESIDEAFAGE